MKRATVLPLLLIFLSPIFAQEETLLLNAESAVLVGIDSKQVLFEKNGERICPPASMTKLVTAYTAMRLWENRGWDLDRRFLVPPAADFRAAPPHSSLMFLQAGQIVSLKELLCGLMIPSGNDAAVAVALLTVGSVEEFVLEMNRTMESLGFGNCQFADASGYSPQNRISPREFAFFCIELIQKYPVIAETASLPSFTYPQPHNLNGTAAVYGFVRQINHNEIIGAFSGAVGLKTGYIDASGKTAIGAVSIERRGDRLIFMQEQRPVKVILLEKPPLVTPGKSVHPKFYPFKTKKKFDFDPLTKYININ